MIDPFGRTITYLRVSVTDRCDFRCVYCMAEDMSFLPKSEVLTLEELDRLCSAFVGLGVRKLRLTGGEPLVRRNIMSLSARLGRHLGSGALDELTLTTNGSQLARYAAELYECGVRRINVSLDTLDPAKFAAITRWGKLDKVMAGLQAAKDAGLAVKINVVALKGVNDDEFDDLVAWAASKGFDLVFIEVMPMGDIGGETGSTSICRCRWCAPGCSNAGRSTRPTTAPAARRAMPSSRETGRRLGFITPLTHNFCESCNRVRVTCTGTLYMCLGQEDAADLRAPLRLSEGDVRCSRRRSTRRSRASPRAMISSSTAATSARRCPAI